MSIRDGENSLKQFHSLQLLVVFFSFLLLPPHFSFTSHARAHLFFLCISPAHLFCLRKVLSVSDPPPTPPTPFGCQSKYDCWLWTELCQGFSCHCNARWKYTVAHYCQSRGGQAGSWRKETNYTPCHTHTPVRAHTYALIHALAAQLGLNGVSSLTYFFIVTLRQTLCTLALNINSPRGNKDCCLHNVNVQEQEGPPTSQSPPHTSTPFLLW